MEDLLLEVAASADPQWVILFVGWMSVLGLATTKLTKPQYPMLLGDGMLSKVRMASTNARPPRVEAIKMSSCTQLY